MQKTKHIIYIIAPMLLLFGLNARAQRDTLYLWQSSEGTVIERGGEIVQHNGSTVKRLNQECSGYYVVTLCGKSNKIENPTNPNASSSCYMTITLTDGTAFTEGDELTISGMRNINKDYKATIYFLYSNGTTVLDTNVWNNLGQYKEMTFGGGTSSAAKGMSNGTSTQSMSTEPFTTFSTDPSTFTYTIPEEANGSTSLTLALNEDSETYLYLTSIVLTRESTATDISNLCTSPIIVKPHKRIVKGHMQIEYNNKVYSVDGKETRM